MVLVLRIETLQPDVPLSLPHGGWVEVDHDPSIRRAAENDVVLEDPAGTISKRHCTIKRLDAAYGCFNFAVIAAMVPTASSAAVDRCSASKAQYLPRNFVSATTNYEIISAAGPTWASMSPLPRGAFIICAEQPLCLASWKPRNDEAHKPNC